MCAVVVLSIECSIDVAVASRGCVEDVIASIERRSPKSVWADENQSLGISIRTLIDTPGLLHILVVRL